ncbi:MAG: exopolysaccharide biosynthesis protein [Flavobacteriales bacterium]|jgi:exopolysaccharide biosynthesis protein
MGNSINNVIDNLLSTFWRLLDLPLYALVIMMLLSMFVTTLIIRKFFKKTTVKRIWIINGVLGVFVLLFIIDKKFSNMRKEITFMNEKISDTKMTSGSGSFAIQKNLVYDIDPLKEKFPDAKIYEKAITEAIDVISFKTNDPNVMTYISIIDLDYPGVQIKVSPEKKHKYLTTTFAEENNCIVAINGEAGLSMGMDCELGEWTGNWISDGNVVLMTDTDKRPFIGFDKQSRAHYSIESVVDTLMNADKYNAIWGRFDILVDNEIVSHENDNPYARTVMGTNADGSILYLMIVDGKRPDYSEGLTYTNCASILQALGASHAMACDQGGSSCMYVKPMGGIINRPADNDGLERPIYSHFGISM